MRKIIFTMVMLVIYVGQAKSQSSDGWYTEGADNIPTMRIRIAVSNPLDKPVKASPVVIPRNILPIQNVIDRWIQVVDPALPSNKEPTVKELEAESGYLRRKETYGHYVEMQVDDLDKDGIWDEIFFMTDLDARETREFYIYIGSNERGMFEHKVHAATANYGRQTVPLWESKDMGWKLWYPHDVDLHGKREPMLTAYYEYSTNKSGYYMPFEMGTDIMTVANTFGAGGMCVFEDPNDMENPSRAYHSPSKNKGPVLDSRFAFDVVFNGPLRSMIKVTTTNWNSGRGFYELDQYYTAYAGKSWSTVRTKFNKFIPPGSNANFGAGIRRIMNEYTSVNKKGIAISMGKNIEARIPDEDIGDDVLIVPWQGIGIVIRDEFMPEYKAINNYGGNHLFKMPVTSDLTFEYMIVGGWSFGEVNNNEKEFISYIDSEALSYNNPPIVQVYQFETKQE